MKEETAAKEYNWETIDLLVNKERELEEEKRSLIRRLAKEIEVNDNFKGENHLSSITTSTPFRSQNLLKIQDLNTLSFLNPL